MNEISLEKWDNVISPKIPVLKTISLEEFRQSYMDLKIYELIHKLNLESVIVQSEKFFRCIPDAEEIAAAKKMSPEIIQMHLDAGCSAGRIAEIRIEHTEEDVPRKITGFIIMDHSVIETILRNITGLLEQEYLTRFKINLPIAKIIKEIQSNLINLEGTLLGRLFHAYEALNEINESLKNIGERGRDTYNELLEKKMWQTLEVLYRSQVSGMEDFSENASRRAEDSEKWKSYARDKTFNDPIMWKQTCKSLGPFFTSRILLRREKFDDIMELLNMKDACGNPSDLVKMLKDCRTVTDRFAEKGEKEKIAKLNQIIAVLESMLAAN